MSLLSIPITLPDRAGECDSYFSLFSSRWRMLNGTVVHSESEFAVYIHLLHESGASSIDK